MHTKLLSNTTNRPLKTVPKGAREQGQLAPVPAICKAGSMQITSIGRLLSVLGGHSDQAIRRLRILCLGTAGAHALDNTTKGPSTGWKHARLPRRASCVRCCTEGQPLASCEPTCNGLKLLVAHKGSNTTSPRTMSSGRVSIVIRLCNMYVC